MIKPLILKVAIPAVPFFQLFEYLAPENDANLQAGIRLEVPFGKTSKVAFLIATSFDSVFPVEKLKPIKRIIDDVPLLAEIDLKLLNWVANYYHHPIGEVMSAAFPVALRQGKDAIIKKLPKISESETKTTQLICNEAQQNAIDKISETLDEFNVFVLDGVTGSGKTEVYMQLIQTVLDRQQQVLVLVPEITLTPQLQQRFQARFSTHIAISHSKLTDLQRKNTWILMQSGVCSLLLGTRSALFTPLPNIGLIILDEEHDSSFKQQEGFRFSARDVAVMRGKLASVPVVLGSATPSLESLYNVFLTRYQYLRLPERAGDALPPLVEIIDIRRQKLQAGLSLKLLEEITATLAKKEQVLLFLNRRGFAPTLICDDCGWVARCVHCDANLVIHRHKNLLRCHHCGTEHRLISNCVTCQSSALVSLGLGTERLELILTHLFPEKKVIRLDRDSTSKKGALNDFLAQIHTGDAHIILGTQLLAKGHHFPNVTLVAILDVDSGLFSTDFHSGEKLAQLIVQVSGRSGREKKQGKVFLQTRQPTHSLLTELLREGYARFAESELAMREMAFLPPFSYQALLRAHSEKEDLPPIFLQSVVNLAQSLNLQAVQILGPIPAPMARRAGQYRFHLLFQHESRAALHKLLRELIPQISTLNIRQKVRWSLDVDPVDLY
ncbi:MAG: primosomal protein N' [Methylococcaceae bacterium]|nr:primosomal protein N' [Methylococcaceae bacterium]